MPDTPTSPRAAGSIPALIGGLYFEFCLLIFCAAILSQTGQTKGPVFDVVGPDFLPSSVAWIVALLVTIQIVVHILGWRKGAPDTAVVSSTETATGRVLAAIFSALTVLYAVVLSNEFAPFYLATAIYLTVCTVLLSRRFNWRDLAVGAVVGLVMGVGLQWLFTNVFIIDLPV